MTEITIKNRRPNFQKLLSFGFEDGGLGYYIYRRDLAGGQMTLTVAVTGEGRVLTEVIDIGSGGEYVLHRVAGATGAFVGRVREEYQGALDEISQKCFEPEVFKSEQAKSIITHLRDVYGDELEYLWQKFPENAVVRRKDNKKWYAAVLTVSRRKLGLGSDEIAEILDLRVRPEELPRIVDNVRYFPGYHMNKKHWITICLDGTVGTDEIYSRIGDSYELAK